MEYKIKCAASACIVATASTFTTSSSMQHCTQFAPTNHVINTSCIALQIGHGCTPDGAPYTPFCHTFCHTRFKLATSE